MKRSAELHEQRASSMLVELSECANNATQRPVPLEDHALSLHGTLAVELLRHHIDGDMLPVSVDIRHFDGRGLQLGCYL